ncbi:MAG TPA: TonB-dependent receptor [Sphingobacteriaceae bacterium]
MIRLIPVVLLSGASFLASGQEPSADTTGKLPEVVVKAYFSEQPLLRSPVSATIITASDLVDHSAQSLVSALNTAPGLRMEERSPGSYRLSIRGSLLRSPFGIRNVKMYIDEIPLTDAGGNTYLNSLDASAINNVTVLKGAEASIYGANTGGVILIPLFGAAADSVHLSASLAGGSFGYLHERIMAQRKWKDYQAELKQAYQRSDGYRQNSGLMRLYTQLNQQWRYAPKATLKALLLHSDLRYETPGGLTRAQAEQDPRMARPATATAPGAAEQQAGIYNNTLLGGLVNEIALGTQLRHVLAVSASYTDFKNPFITNYETRIEKTAGLRSYIEYHQPGNSWNWKANIGLETQRTSSDISNYVNVAGKKGDSQSRDKLTAAQSFLFGNLTADVGSSVVIQASLSYSFYAYRYRSLFPAPEPEHTRQLPGQFMPRLAAAWRFTDNLGWRLSISRGYSPPTTAEVRASDQIINTGLDAETGWNYETGIRFNSNNGRFYLDANTFDFALKNAIVRRVNATDAEYFINAGGTRQRGIEFYAISRIIADERNAGITGLQLKNSYTYSHFTFSNYISGDTDYSGNRLTGVPEHVLTTSVELNFLNSFSVFALHNFTSSLPLNDANNEYADKYNQIQLKLTWIHKKLKNRYHFETFGGIDNLLNESYSLGNDLNAFGGRYFNPAATTSFYAGLTIKL